MKTKIVIAAMLLLCSVLSVGAVRRNSDGKKMVSRVEIYSQNKLSYAIDLKYDSNDRLIGVYEYDKGKTLANKYERKGDEFIGTDYSISNKPNCIYKLLGERIYQSLEYATPIGEPEWEKSFRLMLFVYRSATPSLDYTAKAFYSHKFTGKRVKTGGFSYYAPVYRDSMLLRWTITDPNSMGRDKKAVQKEGLQSRPSPYVNDTNFNFALQDSKDSFGHFMFPFYTELVDCAPKYLSAVTFLCHYPHTDVNSLLYADYDFDDDGNLVKIRRWYDYQGIAEAKVTKIYYVE